MAENQDSETTQSEKFYKYFRQELTDTEEKINNLSRTSATGGERKFAIDHCYAAINRLSDEALKASIYLAPHDRRTYGEAITGLRQQLSKTQDALNGKKKFSFKSGGSRAGASVQKNSTETLGDAADASRKKHDATTVSETGHATEGAGDDVLQTQSMLPTPTLSQSRAVDLEDHNGQHLLVPSYRDSEACSGSIVNVHRCVIHKKMANEGEKGTPLAGLTLKNVSESLVICGSIHGPVHLTNITDSIIVVASQQFRMHESRGCDVYLHTSSRPIIEDCHGIRFAPLPDIYQVERAYATEDQWREVDDFNWHRMERSPNWSVLPVENRIKEDVWRDVVPGKPFKGVEDILSALDITKGSSD